MKKIIKKINEKMLFLYTIIISTIMLNTNIAFAEDLLNNPLTEGVTKMLQDGLKLLQIIATPAVAFFIALFQIKKKISDDEMEGKQYDKKTKATIVCYLVIMTVSIIVQVISGYFNVGGVSV